MQNDFKNLLCVDFGLSKLCKVISSTAVSVVVNENNLDCVYVDR